uniref:Cyclic nucleotide-binding domain-containing protein n=1 Tax=Cryptomonas curvata TaxID=233186 RepID=A0A7S0QRJ0_9CRYP|mmetsp:Transcript_46743/g.97810  ORF Transcript_46743/g.97810 Transcript_46743/m.97810 type:complete len:192 (+) Transcript_46743:196-771(+)
MSWFSCCSSERTPRSFEMKVGNAAQDKRGETMLESDNLSPRKLSVLYEAMENAEIEQAIVRVPLFAVLTHSEVSTLVKNLSPILVNNGEYVYRQGDEGDTFFVIYSGEVEKVVESPGKPGIVMGQPLTAGHYFGQLGLLNRDERRTCSMRARGLAELRYIRRTDFYDKVGDLRRLLQRNTEEWLRYESYFK